LVEEVCRTALIEKRKIRAIETENKRVARNHKFAGYGPGMRSLGLRMKLEMGKVISSAPIEILSFSDLE
jgi:hypothetical protein